ncbi:MAG: hypothetical protein AB7E47_04115 [Desulfovibrionaceae bacterium]
MSKRKILILNAGMKQIPVVRRARERGLWSVVADSRDGQLCFPLADAVWSIAPFELDALSEAAAREGIAGVVYTTSEYAMDAAWRLTRELDLPTGLTEKAFAATRSKLAMRALFAAAGIGDIPFACVDSVGAVEAFAAQAGYPVILKPTNAGNQVGMFLLDSPEDVVANRVPLEEAFGRSEYLAEKLYQGRELNAVGLFLDGEMADFVVSDRLHYGPAHNFVVHEHRYPSQETAAVLEQARGKLEAIGKALELRHSIVFVQFIVADEVVRTIELGVRVPGGMMWHMFRWACGVDLMATWFDISVDKAFSAGDVARLDAHGGVCIRFLSGPPGPLPQGRLHDVEGLAAVRAMPGVRFADFYNKFNQVTLPDAIPPLRDGSDRFFCCITTGDTYDDALALNRKAESMLRFVVSRQKGE